MPTRPIATKIVKRLTEEGYVTYFAGGWVRDFLMRHPSDDIDIATSAPVEVVRSIFPKTVPVGVAFGIVIVIEEGVPFEVATFRKDRGYVDGRRPIGIDPATPEEDAQRRDFTINGMFFNPLNEQIFDFVEGQKDIKRGIIRAIGNPHERFLEDRLRMMRAVRYSTRFNFPIESETLQAILAHSNSLVPAVAMERIWQEFKKMSQFAHFDTGLVTLHRLNLLSAIFPQLKTLSPEEIQQRVWPIEHFPKKTAAIAELLELFPSSSLDEQLAICDQLKVSRKERELAEFLFHAKEQLFAERKGKTLELIDWAHFYAHPDAEIAIAIAAAHLALDERAPFIESHAERRQLLEQAVLRIRAQSPIVRSEDLKKEGVLPGKKMGLLLKKAERISVNQNLENREAIIEQLKRSPEWNV